MIIPELLRSGSDFGQQGGWIVSHDSSTGIVAGARKFFYDTETPYGLALCRMLLCAALLSMYVPRWPVARELYSTDGATAQLGAGYGYLNFMPEFSAPVIMAMISILVLTLVTAGIGFRTRTSLIIAGTLHTYFSLIDSVSTMTKYTVIATHMFLILSVSHCGALWSVDAWLKGCRRNWWPGDPIFKQPQFPIWPRRLLQLHVGLVYFGAAITKMNTPTYLSGDQLQFWMQTHLNSPHPLGELLSLYPVLMVAMGYIALVWEIIFVFLVWNRAWRPWILAVGVLFHTLTVLTLGLMLFPVIMFAVYLSFVETSDVQRAGAWFRRLMRRRSWLASLVHRWREQITFRPISAGWQSAAAGAFAFGCVAVAGGGVELEYWLDPYEIRRPEGRHVLEPLDPAVARTMLTAANGIRDIDKFTAIDTGTILVGDMLVDRRKVFRQGEKMITQCTLSPPHEDLWLECRLVDADNVEVQRAMAVARCEQFRSNLMVPLNDQVAPGEYKLIVELAGREVTQKNITVLPRSGSLSAN